jgi:6-phosphofructokinase 1
MWGTDISIGADTALHRITDAVDAISSTAASHQRTFVVEVMGRHCGYLALMGALATGADWVLIPENPPNLDNWEDRMCAVLHNGREIGRRDSIVIVAEGAQDRQGNPVTGQYVQQVLTDRLHEDARVTILGHVQRGGSPTAFDRNLSTLTGVAAVDHILSDKFTGEAHVIGLKGNKIVNTPLEECLRKTREINEAVKNCEFERAMALRGNSFREAFQTLRTLVRALPHEATPGQRPLRIGVLNAGAPSPGMNTIVRAVIRLGLDRGHEMFGVYNGFRGLASNQIARFEWMSVNGWAYTGGSELGTNRHIPENGDFYNIARHIEEHKLEGLLIIGGSSAYLAAMELYNRRSHYPAFNLPIVLLPATIDNDLPGSELSVGADTALNNIVDAVDKIKQSAVASRRVFVVEVMGRRCGYLALMSALASGSERVYLHEEGVTLDHLRDDVAQLKEGFQSGKRLGVIIRSEGANETYSTAFMCSLLEEEGRGLFTARQCILGHLQQGGNPSPFDRILGTRLAAKCISYLEEQIGRPEPESGCIGLLRGSLKFTDLRDIPRLMDMVNGRPKEQWWLSLQPIAHTLAQASPREPVSGDR